MDVLTKKVSVIWVVVLPVLTFILGPGFIWEWRRVDIESGRLDIEKAQASYEMRAKMTPLLLEIIKLPIASPERTWKEKDFNTAEQNLARIEGRTGIIYDFKPPIGTVDMRIEPNSPATSSDSKLSSTPNTVNQITSGDNSPAVTGVTGDVTITSGATKK